MSLCYLSMHADRSLWGLVFTSREVRVSDKMLKCCSGTGEIFCNKTKSVSRCNLSQRTQRLQNVVNVFLQKFGDQNLQQYIMQNMEKESFWMTAMNLAWTQNREVKLLALKDAARFDVKTLTNDCVIMVYDVIGLHEPRYAEAFEMLVNVCYSCNLELWLETKDVAVVKNVSTRRSPITASIKARKKDDFGLKYLSESCRAKLQEVTKNLRSVV